MTDVWDEYDLIIARGFGFKDQKSAEYLVRDWVRRHFGEPAHIVSSILSVGAVWVLDLPRLGRVVLKAWGGDRPRAALAAQMRVQSAFAASGRPAPQLLSDVLPFGAGCAVLMEYRDGAIPDVRAPGVIQTMAAGLADFVAFARSLPPDPDLPLAERVETETIWIKPHNALFDFGKTKEGAEWIDAAAREALATINAARGLAVPGHLDWGAKNLRMHGGKIVAIFDWDSVFRWPETLIAGNAAAHFPMQWDTDAPVTPSLTLMSRFLSAYENARGARFSDAEMAEVAAAVTYARAYKARCEHCWDPDRSRKWEDSSRRALWELGAYTPAMLRGGNA